MAVSSREPNVSLRLIIDEERNKVVLAEAGRDFVQVLFSLLTLPMGTIVRLLEKHQKSVTIGCFNNLYTSAVDMNTHYFETEACKQMLVYPRSVGEAWCRTLKLNINPTEGFKCFACPSCYWIFMCSSFSTCLCKCGKSMNKELSFLEDEKVPESMQNDLDRMFTKDRSCFFITDDLKLAVESTSCLLKTLRDLGCADVSKLSERVLDIGLQEVVTLLQCVFSSNAPLTDTFLKNGSSSDMLTNNYYTSSPRKNRYEEVADKVITFDAIVRKQDMNIMFVECGHDFVDLLFTFLAIPLKSTWEVSENDNTITTLGCVGNLCRSFKDLSGDERGRQRSSSSSSMCVLPYYYSCKKQLLNIDTHKPWVYVSHESYCSGSFSLTTEYSSRPMTFVDPKSDGSGFVKRETKFTVSDDLIVTPKMSSSTFSLLKKLKVQADDLEVQVLNISNAGALNLLRASLVTSSALTSAFKSLLVKEDRLNPISKRPKIET